MGLKALLARRLFPSKKDNFWYCGAAFNYEGSSRDLPVNKFILNPYRDTGGKIPEVGDIVPCIKLNGWIGFYKVIKKWRYSSAGSDFAMWDDGYEINLKLHHVERARKIFTGE